MNSIGNEAFKNCRDLRKVVISGSVTELGNNIFRDISEQAVIYAPQIPFDYYRSTGEKWAEMKKHPSSKGWVLVPNYFPLDD